MFFWLTVQSGYDMISMNPLKAWDHSGEATLVESFTQMFQGSMSGGQTAGGKPSLFLPAEAESREKTAVEQQLCHSKGLAIYQARSFASS